MCVFPRDIFISTLRLSFDLLLRHRNTTKSKSLNVVCTMQVTEALSSGPDMTSNYPLSLWPFRTATRGFLSRIKPSSCCWQLLPLCPQPTAPHSGGQAGDIPLLWMSPETCLWYFVEVQDPLTFPFAESTVVLWYLCLAERYSSANKPPQTRQPSPCLASPARSPPRFKELLRLKDLSLSLPCLIACVWAWGGFAFLCLVPRCVGVKLGMTNSLHLRQNLKKKSYVTFPTFYTRLWWLCKVMLRDGKGLVKGCFRPRGSGKLEMYVELRYCLFAFFCSPFQSVSNANEFMD